MRNHVASLKLEYDFKGDYPLTVQLSSLGFSKALADKLQFADDVWALGCLYYELLTGFRPFSENNFNAPVYFPTTIDLSQEGLALLKQMLCPPTSRITLTELFYNAYITDKTSHLTY